MDRRSFLRGLLTVTAASIAPMNALSAGIPTIVGDGIHDDTDGLLAAINGRPFAADGVVVRNQTELHFSGGTYRMRVPLAFEKSGVSIIGEGRDATILAAHDGPVVTVPMDVDGRLENFTLKHAEGHVGAALRYDGYHS